MGQCCSERDQGSIAKIVEEEKVKLGEGIKSESTPADGKNETTNPAEETNTTQ